MGITKKCSIEGKKKLRWWKQRSFFKGMINNLLTNRYLAGGSALTDDIQTRT